MLLPLATVTVDPRLIAAVSVTGDLLSALGGLYLAYDLLGGNRGPLRTVTRSVTYAVVFGVMYGVPLGLGAGLVIGLGFGLALGLEFWRAQTLPSERRAESDWVVVGFAVWRGALLGVVGGLSFGPRYAVLFGALAALGLALGYSRRLAPTHEYHADPALELVHGRGLLASALRGASTALAGIVAGLLLYRDPRTVPFALELGVIVWLTSSLMTMFSPAVEWWANNLPPRRLGALGAMLVVTGVLLQTFQYWLVLLGVPVS
jgi:hypothetical protein